MLEFPGFYGHPKAPLPLFPTIKPRNDWKLGLSKELMNYKWMYKTDITRTMKHQWGFNVIHFADERILRGIVPTFTCRSEAYKRVPPILRSSILLDCTPHTHNSTRREALRPHHKCGARWHANQEPLGDPNLLICCPSSGATVFQET